MSPLKHLLAARSLLALLSWSAGAALLLAQTAHGAVLSDRTRACIQGASLYHSVNNAILEAIVRHESKGRPNTVTQNSNGTVDIGLTGINSVHLPELQRKGVAPSQLKDECVSVYVGAWKLSQSMFKYNNSWWAVGAYHSKTPVYNTRYQALIYNELVDMNVMPRPKVVVPKLARPPLPPSPASLPSSTAAQAQAQVLVETKN